MPKQLKPRRVFAQKYAVGTVVLYTGVDLDFGQVSLESRSLGKVREFNKYKNAYTIVPPGGIHAGAFPVTALSRDLVAGTAHHVAQFRDAERDHTTWIEIERAHSL